MTSKGFKHSPESIEKMRLSKLGKKRPPFSKEWKDKLRASAIGNKSRTGQKRSESELQKLSNSIKGEKHPLWGKSHSEKTKQKMSLSHKGKTPWNRGKNYPAISGEKHWNWKGGICEENHKIRTSLDYKLWREAVFTRDGFTCVECKVPGGWSKEMKKKTVLNADHIKPFALFPELRFAIDNGRTLCVECHRKTDTYAGRIFGLKIANTNY